MTPSKRQRIAAYALIRDSRDRVLLVRAAPEDSGRWFLPGGGVEFGESPEVGLRREIEEETGQEVGNLRLHRVLSDVSDAKETQLHSVRIIYSADLVDERPLRSETAGGSTVGVAWIALSDIDQLELAPFVELTLSDTLTSR